MAIDNTAPLPTTTAGTAATTATPTSLSTSTRNTSGGMGKDDFLKLLVAQLKNQDPMAPSTDQEWIGQVTQFTQLEQQTNAAKSTAQLVAVDFIDRTVTYTDADRKSQTGVVEQVNISLDGKVTLTVGGKSGIDAGKVTQVR